MLCWDNIEIADEILKSLCQKNNCFFELVTAMQSVLKLLAFELCDVGESVIVIICCNVYL